MTLQPKSAARDFDRQWSQVRGMLREEFGETAYSTWLAPLTLDGLEGERVLLSVPTRFLRDWVAAHYADRIRALWRRVNPLVSGVALNVDAGDASARRRRARAVPAAADAVQRAARNARPPTRDIGAPLDPRCTFENFVVGQPNELAFAAAKRVAEMRRAAVQPAVPLRRRRPRQDPPDARHRLADPPPECGAQGGLPVRREVHVPVHQGVALQGHHELQGAVPLGRRADGRRRPVHRRQGDHPGGVLPHLQHAGRSWPADRDLRRPQPDGARRARGAHPLAAWLGPGGRHPPDHV